MSGSRKESLALSTARDVPGGAPSGADQSGTHPSPGLGEAIAALNFDDLRMAGELDSAERSEDESVVLASFESRAAAEHMLASLGRKFRRTARKGHAEALIISGNTDGSLKLTQSRVASGSALVAAGIGVTVATMAGFIGIRSAFKGAKAEMHAVGERQSHTGMSAERAHELIAEAGPHGALALVRCKDEETRQIVAAHAAESARDSWNGSFEEFLARVDPGEYDWLRTALGRPSSTNR
jgi:hypothetical protein